MTTFWHCYCESFFRMLTEEIGKSFRLKLIDGSIVEGILEDVVFTGIGRSPKYWRHTRHVSYELLVSGQWLSPETIMRIDELDKVQELV